MVAIILERDPLEHIERLTLAEFQLRLAAITSMPSDAVPTLAAAVYYCLPFPPAVVSAWHQSVQGTPTAGLAGARPSAWSRRREPRLRQMSDASPFGVCRPRR